MFIGSHWYKPNGDGAERLLTRIWPLVRARVPGAQLIIAGKSPESIPSYSNPPAGVEFTGFLPDLDALYARSRVVVCPITMGGGTRVKLVEAGGYGKPIVSTRIGAEGLDLEDGVDVLLRDDDRSFADACIRLLSDDTLCARLGAAARAKAVAQYDAAKVERRIANILLSTPTQDVATSPAALSETAAG